MKAKPKTLKLVHPTKLPVQLFRPVYSPTLGEELSEVFKTGWTGLGPKTEEFEKAVAAYLNTPHAIAFNSGTAALQCAIFAMRLQRGSLIITTPMTFISTNHCILQSGAFPVFADINPRTGNIDPKSVKRLISDKFIRERVRALVVVHYGGEPVDMEELYDIANENKWIVLEDAAHAFGAEYEGNRIGCGLSGLVAFSFHAVKPLAIGDGGMLTTHSDVVDEFARRMRWCGIDKSTSSRTTGGNYSWDYNVMYTGFKSHMNDIHAAIGLSQLKDFDKNQAYKQTLVDRYREGLLNIKGVLLLDHDKKTKSANHLMPILADKRDGLMQYLAAEKIQTGVHYRPTHHYYMYRKFETDNGCPNTQYFFERELSLPLHLDMTVDDVDYVCAKIREGVKEC